MKFLCDDFIDEQSTSLKHRNRTETNSSNEHDKKTRDRDEYQDERCENNENDPKVGVNTVKKTMRRLCERTSTSTSKATGSLTKPQKGRQQTGMFL